MGHAVTMKSYTSVLSYFEDFNSQSSLLVNTTFDSMVSGVNGVFSTSDSALTERWTMSSGNRVSNGSNQATAMLAISAELVLLSQTLDSGIQSLQPTFNATLASVELLSKAVFDINAIHADDLGTFELTAENRLTEKTLTSLAPSVLEKVFNGNYSIAMLPVLTSITSIDSAIQDVKALMDAQTEQAENLGKEMLEEALLTPLQQIKDSFQKEQQSYLVFAQNLIDEVDSLQAFDAIASGYLVDILASYLPIIVAVALAVSAAGILLIGFGLATPFAKGASACLSVTNLLSGAALFISLMPFLLLNLFVRDGCDYVREDNLALLENGQAVYKSVKQIQERCSLGDGLSMTNTAFDTETIASNLLDRVDWNVSISFRYHHTSRLMGFKCENFRCGKSPRFYWKSGV